MKILLYLLVLYASVARAEPAGEPFAVSNIPESLLKNASVVKRIEELRFEITEGNKARIKTRVAYTILNDQGERWSYFSAYYDKLRSVEYVEGSLYDATGKKIRSLKKNEIKDVSGTSESLADDNRVKWHSFFYKTYPYTVEYEYEIKFRGTMFLPEWTPQEQHNMSVQQSSLFVVCPATNPLHFKMYNYKGNPSITENKEDKIYHWIVKDLPVIKEEYSAPAWHKLTTSVFMATEKFVLEDYQGSNASWKDFGRFVYDLKKGKDILPDNVRLKVQELTAGTPDIHEKIRRLYEYLQQNTRYISVQLGIGGWQPYDAKYVASKNYGDCKALSNYMFSLLKEAGIPAVYALTNRGYENDYLLAELPSSQFNHAILFVPTGRDTVWLECTSQTLNPGYLGGDNHDRYVLAVKETGGELVRTPRYGYRENLQVRHLTGTIDDGGNLEAVVKTKYHAVQQDRLHQIINGLSKDKLMEFLKEDIDLATYDVKSFEYKEEKKGLPVVDEKLVLVSDNYAIVSGKRLFLVPNVMTRTHRRLKQDEERKYDIVLDFEFRDVDTTEITLPPGYVAESLPTENSFVSKFGKYSSSVKLNGDKLIYYRSYEHYSGQYPAAEFQELVKFYESIHKADRAKVVLVKK